MEQRVLRTGALVVSCAVLLRLASGLIGSMPVTLTPKIASFIIFMQTGRVVRPTNISFSPQQTQSTEQTQPPPPPPTEPELPVFSPEEADRIGITAGFSYSVDKAHLLTQPLTWDLTTDEPKVFYIWGHSYEFDIYPERWEQFEEFCKMISNQTDIFYGTNKEVLNIK